MLKNVKESVVLYFLSFLVDNRLKRFLWNVKFEVTWIRFENEISLDFVGLKMFDDLKHLLNQSTREIFDFCWNFSFDDDHRIEIREISWKLWLNTFLHKKIFYEKKFKSDNHWPEWTYSIDIKRRKRICSAFHFGIFPNWPKEFKKNMKTFVKMIVELLTEMKLITWAIRLSD